MILNKLLSYYNNDNILEFSQLSFLLPNILLHSYFYFKKENMSKYGLILNLTLLASSSAYLLIKNKKDKEKELKEIGINTETDNKLEIILSPKAEEKLKIAESIISINKFNTSGLNDDNDIIEIFCGSNQMYELCINRTELYFNIYFENLDKAVKFREFIYEEYKTKESIIDLYNQDKIKYVYSIFLNSNFILIN